MCKNKLSILIYKLNKKQQSYKNAERPRPKLSKQGQEQDLFNNTQINTKIESTLPRQILILS